MSTPNKHEYLVENEFHERELFHEEFVALLEARFERVEILLQHNWLTSAVLTPTLAREASGDEPLDFGCAKSRASSRAPSSTRSHSAEPASCRSCRPVGVLPVSTRPTGWPSALVEAERTARTQWHGEYRRAEQSMLDLYGSVWWRMTAPLRRLAERGEAQAWLSP